MDETASRDPAPDDDHPREIAGYRIVARIATGGMGIVYEALQDSPRRRIALKVLKTALGSTDARQRFEYEAGILGRLRHPCIAQVYQAGAFRSASGERLPFFAMELVPDARPITVFARERGLGERERLELFVQALDGVHHGHQRGIVHRDLKPANILVDGNGQPKVIDFGVAREIAPEETTTTVHTRTGQVLGTPQYMSPEQCTGQPQVADVRTDVYSAGVVLFELLTGVLPYDFRGRSVLEFARVIREAPPMRASATGAVRPGDLDTILGKALEKDPERRYASVAALAEDVRRYLRCEPIAARPPSAAYQLRMFARRNKAIVVGILGVVVVSLIAALVGTALAIDLGRLAERERRLREQGIVAAARLAARTVAIEVELRWRVIESVAGEPELPALLLESADAGLQQWLEARFARHSGVTKAVSWFVNDAAGVQRARVPFNADTVGRNFAFRDYFHGGGRDLEPSEVVGTPIRSAHRSIVFRSQATENLMVAFSVPILLDDGDSAGRVAGIVGMTVELGRFGVLQLGLGDRQVASLIDCRPDATGERGLVLHHAELARLRLAQSRTERGALPSWYAIPAQVARFDALRAERVAQAKLRQRRPWEEQVVLEQGPGLAAFDAAWRDPVGGDYGGAWIAAFAPVLIEGRPEDVFDTGWVVVVQERADAGE
jgi:hypothetical protein